jgi:AcrR family transcriptional regulator
MVARSVNKSRCVIPEREVGAMAAPTRTPRTTWIQEGLRALGVGGLDAVRIEALAQALGVSKGGFYWQFGDRNTLLEEMLDTWERVVTDEVINYVENGGGDARTKLRRLFAIAVSTYDMINIEVAIRDWARRDTVVAHRLKRVDDRRMQYMRSLFSVLSDDPDDVEARCLLAFSLFIGNHFIAADHGARSREEVMRSAVEKLLA